MNGQILFISDLHLSVERRLAVEAFIRFLGSRASGAEAVYILGDLFDAYVGDDDLRFPNGDVASSLRRLTAAGTKVFFQHGNRDFLVGERFAERTGVQMLEDFAVMDLQGVPTLLTHGDLLCTDDVQYQAARARVRTTDWKKRALSKPLFVRRWYARWYRFKSGRDKSGKTAEIMDVNDDTVVATMRRYGVSRLIHGHTHRPAVHDVDLGERTGQRFVLAEWIDQAEVLAWSDRGWLNESLTAGH
jgi:UDP-2,3-diacylglucosamine hydrolase